MTRARIINARDCARHPPTRVRDRPHRAATDHAAPRRAVRHFPMAPMERAFHSFEQIYAGVVLRHLGWVARLFFVFFRCRAWALVPAAGCFLARKHKKRVFREFRSDVTTILVARPPRGLSADLTFKL